MEHQISARGSRRWAGDVVSDHTRHTRGPHSAGAYVLSETRAGDGGDFCVLRPQDVGWWRADGCCQNQGIFVARKAQLISDSRFCEPLTFAIVGGATLTISLRSFGKD